MSNLELDDILNSTLEQLNNETNIENDLVKLAIEEANPLFEEFKKIFYEEFPQFKHLKLTLSVNK